MRVLIVEDEQDLQNILVKRLNAEYYSVDGCGNGEDALDYISMATYDLIVLDIMIPGIDGLQVLQRLRADNNTTPVLLLTAKDAIAYSKANGIVNIQLFRDETNIIGKVSDNGIGISEQHIAKIWDRFYRVDAARTSSNNGNTGLGLSNYTEEKLPLKVN